MRQVETQYPPTRLLWLVPFMLIMLFGASSAAQTLLPLNTEVSGAVASSDTVSYLLELPTPGEINLHITGWVATLNWGIDYDRVYMTNASGDPVWIEEFGSETDPFLSHMLSDPDDIVIRIGQAGNYVLDLHSGDYRNTSGDPLTQQFTITAAFVSTADVHEVNDTPEAARSLEIGATTSGYQWRVTPTSEVWNDEEYFTFNVPTPGVFTWHLSNWTATLNWSADFDRMYLYDTSGAAIFGGTSTGSQTDPYLRHMLYSDTQTEECTITANLTGPGIYYARFHSGSGYSIDPWSLSTEFLQVDDDHEPNDSVETATITENGVEMEAWQWKSVGQTIEAQGDDDFYAFTALGAGVLTVSMTEWISTYNWGADYDRLQL
ncbi:MAG: hypothetical protein JXR76_04195 [Deltaproteobacteria bacterium]|nr:hypothetical protein [Deltaproteobacteria bacterium]